MRRLLVLAPLMLIGGALLWMGEARDHPQNPQLIAQTPATAAPETPQTTHATPESPKQPDQTGTVIRTPNPAAVLSYAASHRLTVTKESKLATGETLIILADPPLDPTVQALAAELGVTSLATNYRYRALDLPNDPQYGAQWSLPKISAPAAWDVTNSFAGSDNSVLAIIDTGVLFSQTVGGTTYTNADLSGPRQWSNPGETGTTQAGDPCWTGAPESKATNGCDDDANGYADDLHGWDLVGGWAGGAGCPNGTGGGYVSGDSDPGPYSCDNPSSHSQLNKTHYNGSCGYAPSSGGACYVGHGTMVTSVAAADTNNGVLGAGTSRSARIMPLRVLDGYGFGDTVAITSAVSYVTAMQQANPTKHFVINLSLGIGIGETDPTLETALQAAHAAGVVVAAASGNDGAAGVYYPGSSKYAIAVGASDASDNRASFSGFGPELEILAPGAAVPVGNAPSSFNPQTFYLGGNGTSFAAPHAAAAAALLWGRYGSASADQITSRLLGSTDKLSWMNGQNWTSQAGFGRLNLHRAVAQPSLPVKRPNGLLIRGQGELTVYLLQNGEKRGVPTPLALFSYGYGFDQVVVIPAAEVGEYPTGPVLGARTGTLIRTANDLTVYLTDEDPVTHAPIRHGFTSPTAFTRTGLQWSWITIITTSEITLYAPASVISEGSPRPNGLLIHSPGDKTIWVTDGGSRRGFPTPFSLESQNYDWSRIVTISTAELSGLPVGELKLARSGLLIRSNDSFTVYIIDEGTRRGIPSPETLLGIGQSFSGVNVLSPAEVSRYADGPSVVW